eukprot:7930605-Lingulodinium_polyedra.AAC.1
MLASAAKESSVSSASASSMESSSGTGGNSSTGIITRGRCGGGSLPGVPPARPAGWSSRPRT